MKCNNTSCEAEIFPGHKFCSNCGGNVVVQSQPTGAHCPACQQIVCDSDKYCLKCGSQLDSDLFKKATILCSKTNEQGQKCETLIPGDAKFCPGCGTSVKKVIATDDVMKCSNTSCGAKISPGQKFCTDCGSKVVSRLNESHCPSCQHTVCDSDRYCHQCGYELTSDMFKKAPTLCTRTNGQGQKCNTLIPVTAKFCPGCGTSFEDVIHSGNATKADLERAALESKVDDEKYLTDQNEHVQSVEVNEEMIKTKVGKVPPEHYDTKTLVEDSKHERDSSDPIENLNTQDHGHDHDDKFKPSDAELSKENEIVITGHVNKPEQFKTEQIYENNNEVNIGEGQAKTGGHSEISDKELIMERQPTKQTVWRLEVKPTEEDQHKPMLQYKRESSLDVKVVFHAIIHPSMFKTNCTAYIQVESERLKYEVFHESDKGEVGFEVKGTFYIPRKFLDIKIHYRYHTISDEKLEIEEYILNEENWRTLAISLNDYSDIDGYHHYDGVVRGPPSRSVAGIFYLMTGQKAKQHKRILLGDYFTSIDHFMPFWRGVKKQDGCFGEEMIERIKQLYNGLLHFYCKTTYAVSEKDFDSGFTQAFTSRLKEIFQEFTHKNRYGEEEQSMIMVNALTTIYLIVEYSLGSYFEYDEWKVLCLALLPGLHADKLQLDLARIKDALPRTYRYLPITVFEFAKIAIEQCGLHWLCCAPLIHFLNGQCFPGEKTPLDVQHSSDLPTWWGLAKKSHYSFENMAEKLKNEGFTETSLTDIHVTLSPYFDQDYFLPRTFVSCLRLTDLPLIFNTDNISPDIIFATLCHILEKEDISASNSKEAAFVDCLRAAKQKLDKIDIEKNLDCAERSFWIAADIMQVMLSRPSGSIMPDNVLTLGWETFLTCLHLYSSFVISGNSAQQERVEIRIESIQEGTKVWLTQKFLNCRGSDLKSCLQVWNQMLDIRVHEGRIKSQFITLVSSALEDSLMAVDKNTEEDLVKTYYQNKTKYCSTMVEVLDRYVKKAIQRGRTWELQSWKVEPLKRFGVLLSDVFEQSADKDMSKDLLSSLKFALNWKPFSIYLKIIFNKSYSACLTPETCSKMKNMCDNIEDLYHKIIDRTISVKELKIIKDLQDRFIVVVRDMKVKGFNDPVTRKAIKSRLAELDAFTTSQDNLKLVIDVFKRFDADTKDLEYHVNNFADIEEVALNNISKTGFLSDKPKEIAFSMYKDILKIAPDIIKSSRGKIFLTLWDECGSRLVREKGAPLQISEIITKVWKPVQKHLNKFHKKLKTGDVPFIQFEEMCERFDTESLREEFQIMEDGKNPSWINERLDQIDCYKNLRCCGDIARVIIKMKDVFGLEGNFEPIERTVQMIEDKNLKMQTLNMVHHNTISILGDIDHTKVFCLQKFISSKELVDWLRETMAENGLQELKAFVDLAYISAGDDAMSIAKIRCLQSVAIGYAPLIFHLERNSDYKGLLDCCQKVWKALEANPDLPQEIEDTWHNLEWLKVIERSHGSVEVTSLVQVEAINASGVYMIEYKEKTSSKNQNNNTLYVGTNGTQIEMMDVIRLKVTEQQENKTSEKEYNYNQLHDLQSRLMLVAGKAEMGKDDVDRFILILDSVVRLSNAYIKLLAAGCVLFYNFKVELRCDRESTPCAITSFGTGDSARSFLGNQDIENNDVSVFIPKIAKFLEICLIRWLEFINKKRDENPYLNFFSIEQMVILQRELANISDKDGKSNLIYPLLSRISEGFSIENLINIVEKAKLELKGKDLHYQKVRKTPVDVHDPEKTKARFIDKIMERGFSKTMANDALQKFKPDEIEEGIRWCFEQHEESAAEQLTENHMTFNGRSSSNSLYPSSKNNLLETPEIADDRDSVEVLIEKLERVWKNFLATVISSSTPNYISVDHLALILRKLAAQNRQGCLSVKRSFAVCGLKMGKPNLVVCPQSEMYNTVLSIYSTDENSPLPLPDEVLLCTPRTTVDMLEIFWRRALYSDEGKIHCLVNADLLVYEVSDKGEKSLEQHLKNAKSKGIKFQLVVLCSAENEYRSRMVAALDKFRRPQIKFGGENHVKSYLSRQFIVDQKVSGVEPASFVDFRRSSVRVVKSRRAGLGKSLYKKNMTAKLKKRHHYRDDITSCVVTIPLYEKTITIDNVVNILLQHTRPPGNLQPMIFHLDISHEVLEGVDVLLFQLLVLGYLSNSSGYVWRRSKLDYYIIESMPLLASDSDTQTGNLKCLHRCLDILPDVMCRSPKESAEILKENFPKGFDRTDLTSDDEEIKSQVFQRPYKYLYRLDTNKPLTNIDPNIEEGNREDVLQVLLRHCGIEDPSWSELFHFVSFLNRQLQDFETSSFCTLHLEEDLPGFRNFVLKLSIEMSRDFATRSLQLSEESPMDILKRQTTQHLMEGNVDDLYKMRRTWETSPHAYLFFNPDGHTMTFLGFNIEKQSGNLIDDTTGEVLQERLMEPTSNNMEHSLYNGLNSQPGVNLSESFDSLERKDKLLKLCQVMGVEYRNDPDETYELTTDNVKKILAIYMRFRCDIPVIIIGETGCGKTRLVQFMCSLQMQDESVRNMIVMKVHGGTTSSDIITKVRKAEQIAVENAEKYPNMYTVLFFDEANTTEAIGVIKEVMCDKTMGGRQIQLHAKLKIIAACNPYRKHKEELIKKLEQAGLGYHVDADKTTDRLGRVAMRRLVYRVQPLPQSMLPLVWDFGQLNTRVEEMYIRQMVLRYICEGILPNIDNLADVASRILSACQNFMRKQEDECSFVSLRDVERVLKVMMWFYKQTYGGGILHDDSTIEKHEKVKITQAMILALSVCYQACLQKREEFRNMIVPYFVDPLTLEDENQLEHEMLRCQDKFLENVKLADNIARNQALKENVFMMIVCIELRIPLFLVGKPGSSKSLAKTIVADAMQGDTAKTTLFKKYKQVQMVSFQCSPLSTPDGIVGTFKQCAEFQKAKDLDRFVSVVVLDEIGLAEDSPKMPLKTLHPLLEYGYQSDEDKDILPLGASFDENDTNYFKVAFIGISNWALDPAKMNRGIFVQREVPGQDELMNSARGICHTKKDDDTILKLMESVVQPLSHAYSSLFAVLESSKQREFFGLRDFYSLIKMVYAFAAKSGKKPTWFELKHAIMRNFGGLDNVDSVDIFRQCLKRSTVIMDEKKQKGDPDCSSWGMIKACLAGDKELKSKGDKTMLESETRYLLLLTENYGDLEILKQKIQAMQDAQVIFGSSFPSDQEYTQVCRNINRIKVCMETGSTVILLNLENLYESLYDALNQYYVYYGGQRYVDLGLGSHRVKCKVHEKFRLIVVAERDNVYKKFPIPLINRLEKHIFSLKTMLSEIQQSLTNSLEEWVHDYCHVEVLSYLRQRQQKKEINKGDVFIGYHADTCAAIIMLLFEERKCEAPDSTTCQMILDDAKNALLWCATPDSVFRLKSTKLRNEQEIYIEKYFKHQQHNSLKQFLIHQNVVERKALLFAQVTTHSKLLSSSNLKDFTVDLSFCEQDIALLTMQSFDTEQQFGRKIRFFLESNLDRDSLLIVQCDCGDKNANLIACARYSIQGEVKQIKEKRIGNIYVVLLIQLPRIGGSNFLGFQCGLWHSYHIDDLHLPPAEMPSFMDMYNYPISALLGLCEEEKTAEQINSDPVSNEYRNTDNPRPVSHVDIKFLIGKCVQSALAMVKDPESNSTRSIQRIKMFLTLLNKSENDKSFLSGIIIHLKHLLQAKEELDTEHQKWLLTEASTQKHINNAGTFRRAVFQCLEKRIASLLAAIFAFVDRNRNLDIMFDGKNGDWQKFLWVELFNAQHVTQIDYSDCSNQAGNLLSEYFVQSTSYEGLSFNAAMPFSWVLFKRINEVVKATAEEPEQSDKDIVMKAAGIFESTSLGKLLCQINNEDIRQVIQFYIKDFVHMAYPVKSEEEYLVICEHLMIGCKLVIQEEIRELITGIIACHVAYKSFSGRFSNYRRIGLVWQECSKNTTIFSTKEQEISYLQTTEEITLDLMGLILLLTKLEPHGKINDIDVQKQWIQMFCDYRPVVESILEFFRLNKDQQEQFPRTRQAIVTARSRWTRLVVLKLYIENVCNETREIKTFKELSRLLKKDADMKTISSLENVENFLKSCHKVLGTNTIRDRGCNNCGMPFIGEKGTLCLPCGHIKCTRCVDDGNVSDSNGNEITCTTCNRRFPKNFDRVSIEKTLPQKGFRRCCNSFFMEVVSQLCFAEGTPPSDEVVEKLLSYITFQTKDGKQATNKLNIFDDNVDSTPVVRSFLLQLLMQTSQENVQRHLESYFSRALRHVKPAKGGHSEINNLCILVIRCIEDSFYHQYPEENAEMLPKFTTMLEESCNYICLDNDQLLINMHHIAQTRFTLSVTGRLMHKVYGDKSLRTDKELKKLFEAAGQLCENCGSKWPIRYLVKYVCRNYGKDCYQAILNNCEETMKRWISPPELQRKEVERINDMFLTCGEGYNEMRELFVKAALSEDVEKLCELLQGGGSRWKQDVLFNLVVYREFNMENIFDGDHRKFPDRTRTFLQGTLSKRSEFMDRELIGNLLKNRTWKYDLERNVHKGMNLGQQGLSCLLTHCLILFKLIPGQKTLLSPFLNFALRPDRMIQSYFPTMPQVDIDLIKEALNAAKGYEKLVFYKCPNGHLYLIGNCGRPYTLGRCAEPGCGMQIGGEYHRLLSNNAIDDGKDATETGHILGTAIARNNVSCPERSLSKASCAVMRLLLHIAMYVGANTNRTAICDAIKPDIQETDVPLFLIEHIQKDLASISAVLGKSVENVLILIHKLLSNFTNDLGPVNISDDICFLKNKHVRATWEDEFNKRYIGPLVEASDEILHDVSTKIMNDEGFGSDPLLQLMYETQKQIDPLRKNRLSENQLVWQFRERISIDHLMHTVMKSNQNCPVLLQFLEEEHLLRVLRFVPGIIRLQRILINKYSRRLEKAEAVGLTMDRVLKDLHEPGSGEIDSCWNDFKEAWESVRHHLEGYVVPLNGNFVDLPKDICQLKIDDRTSVSYILPTYRDNGLCSFILLFFLLERQNLFLEKYCQVKGISYESLPKVYVRDVSPAHLISYHPSRDLLPMVLANCNYSFQVGQGTKVYYDFANVERQLIDRFILTKSVVQLKEIDTVVYHSEITNAVVFSQLREKIQQERISQSALVQIQSELRNLEYPELCSSMDNLNIAISFLKSVGPENERSLKDFVVKILKIENPFVSNKVHQVCKCKHAQSLWLQFALERTKRLEKYHQESFDGVSTSLKSQLSHEEADTLRKIFEKLKPGHLSILLEILFECIMLMIDIPQKDAESVDMSGVRLSDALSQYFYDYPYAEEIDQPPWMQQVIDDLSADTDMNKLLCAHVVDTWVILFDVHEENREEDLY